VLIDKNPGFFHGGAPFIYSLLTFFSMRPGSFRAEAKPDEPGAQRIVPGEGIAPTQ